MAKKLIDKLKKLPFLKDIEKAKGNLYAVGGAVRDELLKIKSKDLDLLVTGIPQPNLVEILNKYGKVDEVGKSFGVIKFKSKDSNEDIDIALPRKEKSTGDGHKDFEVQCDHTLKVEDDLARRDFTMNAVALDASTGKYIDPYNGIDAINKKVISVITNNSFNEDPLRMLRAAQFATRFSFEIHSATKAYAKLASKKLLTVSRERILEEFKKVVKKKTDVRIFWKHLLDLDIKNYCFPTSCGYYEYGHYLNHELNTLAEMLFYFAMRNNNSNDYKNYYPLDNDTQNLLDALSHMEYNYCNLITVFEAVDKCPAILNTTVFDCNYTIELQNKLNLLKSKTYINSLADVKCNGYELMQLGLEGKQIGSMFKTIVRNILNDNLKNEKEDILEFVKSKMNE